MSIKKDGRMTYCRPCVAAEAIRRQGGYKVGPRGSYYQLPVATGQRRCRSCGLVKPLDQFFGQGSYRKSWCKPCDMFRSKTRYGIKNGQIRHRRWLLLRAWVFWMYGPVCACCGEAETIFLTIDHVNDDGWNHRKQIGESRTYEWLRRHGYPPEFQTLCRNCNWAKHMLGTCPHQSR